MTRGFVYINDLYNPLMYVLYVEQSILQTVKNLTFFLGFLDCWEDLKTVIS